MVRRRLDAEQSRNLILDAVERLMKREGFAVVNTRSVAAEAGMKPPLVHYHFDTTENLLLESYRRSAARTEILLHDALRSERPVRALWKYNADPERTALATQFMALAAERPSIGAEMAGNVDRFRVAQAEVLGSALPRNLVEEGFSADVVAMLIAALGRAFVMEESIGIARGHDGMRSLVEVLLQRAEPDPPEA